MRTFVLFVCHLKISSQVPQFLSGITWNAANYIVHLLSHNYTADCTIREIEDNLKGTPSCFENHKHILANLETNGVVRITNPEGYRRSGAFADHYFVSLA